MVRRRAALALSLAERRPWRVAAEPDSLDLHYHGILLDGVYTGSESADPLTFHNATYLTDSEVESMLRHIRALIFGLLRRRGPSTSKRHWSRKRSTVDPNSTN